MGTPNTHFHWLLQEFTAERGVDKRAGCFVLIPWADCVSCDGKQEPYESMTSGRPHAHGISFGLKTVKTNRNRLTATQSSKLVGESYNRRGNASSRWRGDDLPSELPGETTKDASNMLRTRRPLTGKAEKQASAPNRAQYLTSSCLSERHRDGNNITNPALEKQDNQDQNNNSSKRQQPTLRTPPDAAQTTNRPPFPIFRHRILPSSSSTHILCLRRRRPSTKKGAGPLASDMQEHSQPDEGYSEDPLNPSPISLLGPSSISVGPDTVELPASHDLASWLSKSLPYLPVSIKSQLAIALLDDLPSPVIAQIAERLRSRLYIDFVRYIPPEICLKIFGYLDPVSLVNVACCCRSWYSLAVDWKLWERLYHLEGWRAVYPEIEAWEAKVNEGIEVYNSAVSTYHRVMASEGGHTSKKRALSGDQDSEMPDADRPSRLDDPSVGSSIFASPHRSSSSPSTSRTPADQSAAMDVDGAGASSKNSPYEEPHKEDVKGKGKAREVKDESSRKGSTALVSSNLPEPSIWVWDALNSRYRLNWRYVYSLRRRLESNWEQGKFVNFQLPLPDHPEEGHQECIYTLQFDSQYLVSGSRDRTIRIWGMKSRRLLRPPLKGHSGSVLSLQFDADPEEDVIVSGSSDSNVIIWRFSTGEIIQRLTTAHTDSVLNVKFDKRILVTCSKDKTIKIFNRRPLKYGDVGYPHTDPINPVPIRVRDYRYGSPTDSLPVIPPYTMIGRLEGHGAAVNAVQIHGNEVVSASGDRNIKVWDWPNQICSRTVVGHGKGIACVQYDGRRIVSGSSDNEIKVFDGATGIEVASLRAHSHLVRTVQAGFGDLPYSQHEDKLVAKKLDEQYLKALESGTLPAGHGSRGRLSRSSNAGSRRLEDINAYGAWLPPGGGGGRYARIVSGSYDQRIIIWRRDEDDTWVPAHRLYHEQVVEAAQARSPTPVAPPRSAPPPSSAGRPAATAPGSQASLHHTTLPNQSSNLRSTIESPIIATITPDSAASFMALIDIIVPQGVLALQQALASYPTMLAYQAHLQAAINREPLPAVRGQLRQVVANAIVATQQAQARTRLASMQHTNGPIAPPTLPPLSTIAGPSTSTMGAAASSSASGPHTTTTGPRGNRTIYDPTRPTDRPSESTAPVVAVGTSGTVSAQDASLIPGSAYRGPPLVPQVEGHIHIQGQGATPSVQHHQQVPAAPVQSHSILVPPAQAAAPPPPPPPSQGQTQEAQQAQGQTQTQAHHPPQQQAAQGGAAAHHPPPANTDTTAARVFKLQFDACRIICCSQTSVIVGWDFCNGDPELEVVSRIFDNSHLALIDNDNNPPVWS
ncbi:hypothetical protein SODALDRAFT_360637 [Sodiomyces alkalinus F11]|uniref:F-box domain-containing protein n=1 Tax=Sodiomyces alkalinus (strain CBS 110278 / VKM F-3762 / F11) TaxID=1314773 RepID=A0A3N2PUU9_SODAK|nr:hypothetical protein SODALDRAFT_360637 [Sodiomyces alkalinus F11]ROT38279.1 hypothetical protein SODALDRAFT_360637 [Sodiomyces alkalinus F11]